MDIRLSNVAEMRALGAQLFAANEHEVVGSDSWGLDLDWPRYEAIEREGVTLILGAWDGEQLAGYSVNVLGPHLHYRSRLVCSNDVIYLTPEQRHGAACMLLMDATEQAAKKRGCVRMEWPAPTGSRLERILQLGTYRALQTTFARDL